MSEVEVSDMIVESKESTESILTSEDSKMEDSKEDEPSSNPENIVKLAYNNTNDEEDPEESVIMTGEEVRSYLLQKIGEYMKDPEINPLLALKNQAFNLQEKIRQKNEDFAKLNKSFDLMYRDQEKFLRHVGILPKVPVRSVQLSVDFPILPNNLVPSSNNNTKAMHFKTESCTSGATESPSRSQALGNNAQTVGHQTPKKLQSKPPTHAPVECIDLTDDADLSNSGSALVSGNGPNSQLQHPAPLPPIPCQQLNRVVLPAPPKPRLKISADNTGIVLQWDLPREIVCAKVGSFEIFGYQEQKQGPISSALWKKIGSVRAMNLPMACTLTHFMGGYRYHFSIRAVDNYGRFSSYSDPASIKFVTEQSTSTSVVKIE